MYKACLSNDSNIDVFITCDGFVDMTNYGSDEMCLYRSCKSIVFRKETFFYVSFEYLKYIKDLDKGVLVYER